MHTLKLASQFSDFRPVALTSFIAKCMEIRVCNQCIKYETNRMDPLQFAYIAKRGVHDATLTLFNLIASHSETSGITSCIHGLFRRPLILYKPMF